ncbi:MAG: putative small permease component [Pseudomonadota bacterium]|jgi:TRAP-type C4-dicarboxylate transport system permease small subunit
MASGHSETPRPAGTRLADLLVGGLDRLALWFAVLGASTAAAIGGMTVASVTGRSLWSAPIPGDVEVTQVGIGLALSLCLPWCQAKHANIIVDFFTQRAPRAVQRALDQMGTLLLAAMYLLLAWRTAVAASSVKEAGETTMVLMIPMWWAYACLAPGLGLAAGIALLQVVRSADTPAEPSATPTQTT